MIVSHEHRYVFVELPHTGSTAVARELCEHYGGEAILSKHSTYREFLSIASEDERRYFTFSAVRNPLDLMVTKYLRFYRHFRGRTQRLPGFAASIERRIAQIIQDRDMDFSTFLKTFVWLPFNTWATLDHQDMDYVMRFESLQADFQEVINRIGLDQVRPLPVVNPTMGKSRDFAEYYANGARERAKRVFVGYMNEWGYRFPETWGRVRYSTWDRLQYLLVTRLYMLYWVYLKNRI